MTDQDKARGALADFYAGNNVHAFIAPAGRRGDKIFLFRVTTAKDNTGIVHPVKVSAGRTIVGTPAERRLVVSGGAPPAPQLRPFGRQSTVIRKTHLAPRTLESTGWTGTEEELADREG